MVTSRRLAARRALVVASLKRRPPRPVPRALLPRPTQYTRALTTIATDLNDAIAAALEEVLATPRADAADGDALPTFNRRDLLARLRRIAEAVVKKRGAFLDTAIDAVAGNVTRVSKVEWAKQAQAVVGIDLSKLEPNLTPTIDSFRRANVELITSMARDKVERVKALLEEHASARVETLRDKIMEERDVTKRQAALIARDQVLSLNAQVTEKRHAAAGIEKYVWRTSGDGDVRPAHRALNGKTFRYDDPPVVDARTERRENPGQDYQCRCTAEPVIEWGDESEAPATRADAGDFKESEHPRDKDGEFTEKGAGSEGKSSKGEPSVQGVRDTPSLHRAHTLAPGDPLIEVRRRAPLIASPSEGRHLRQLVSPGDPPSPHVDALAEAVSSVHRLPPMEAIIADVQPLPPGMHARYRTIYGFPTSITTSPDTPRPYLETLHEVGHYIDDAGFGELGRFASETEPAFADVMNAIHGSPTVARLRAMRSGVLVTPSGHQLPVASAQREAHVQTVRYALENRELFARAYAQYITAESQHPHLVRDLGHALDAYHDRMYGSQWPHEEFEPVRAAFRGLFRRLRWHE